VAAANNLMNDLLPTREVPCPWPVPALAGWYCCLGILVLMGAMGRSVIEGHQQKSDVKKKRLLFLMAFSGVSCQGEFKNTKTTTAIIAPKITISRQNRPTDLRFFFRAPLGNRL
jgi:hypothetical protein